MRESSLQTLVDRRHALLDQASAALRGRVVALWRMVREDQAVTEIVSASENTLSIIEFDLAGWLQRWAGRLRLKACGSGAAWTPITGMWRRCGVTRLGGHRPGLSVAAPSGW